MEEEYDDIDISMFSNVSDETLNRRGSNSSSSSNSSVSSDEENDDDFVSAESSEWRTAY